MQTNGPGHGYSKPLYKNRWQAKFSPTSYPWPTCALDSKRWESSFTIFRWHLVIVYLFIRQCIQQILSSLLLCQALLYEFWNQQRTKYTKIPNSVARRGVFQEQQGDQCDWTEESEEDVNGGGQGQGEVMETDHIERKYMIWQVMLKINTDCVDSRQKDRLSDTHWDRAVIQERDGDSLTSIVTGR